MGGIIVAMSGATPQVEREADGLGLVALVSLAPPQDWDGNPATTLQGRAGKQIRTVGNIKPQDYLRWFDKATLFDKPLETSWPADPYDLDVAHELARDLLPALVTRPRLVLLGSATAAAFGVWEDNCFLRWRWAHWSLVHEDLKLDNDHRQLIAVVPHTSNWANRADRAFWQGLAGACKNKRVRVT